MVTLTQSLLSFPPRYVSTTNALFLGMSEDEEEEDDEYAGICGDADRWVRGEERRGRSSLSLPWAALSCLPVPDLICCPPVLFLILICRRPSGALKLRCAPPPAELHSGLHVFQLCSLPHPHTPPSPSPPHTNNCCAGAAASPLSPRNLQHHLLSSLLSISISELCKWSDYLPRARLFTILKWYAVGTLQNMPEAHEALMQLLPPLTNLEEYVVYEEMRATCLPHAWQEFFGDMEELDAQAKHTWELLVDYDETQQESQQVGVVIWSGSR